MNNRDYNNSYNKVKRGNNYRGRRGNKGNYNRNDNYDSIFDKIINEDDNAHRNNNKQINQQKNRNYSRRKGNKNFNEMDIDNYIYDNPENQPYKKKKKFNEMDIDNYIYDNPENQTYKKKKKFNEMDIDNYIYDNPENNIGNRNYQNKNQMNQNENYKKYKRNNDIKNYNQNNANSQNNYDKYKEKYYDNNRNRKIFSNINNEGKNEKELNNNQNNNNLPYIPHKKLKELNDSDNENIINFFYTFPQYEQLINGTNFKNPEMIFLLMNIIKRISEINSGPATQIISSIIDNTNFFEKELKTYIEEESLSLEYLNVINNYLIFNLKVLNKFSDKSKKLHLWEIEETVESLKKSIGDKDYNEDFRKISLEIIKNYKELKDKRIKLKEEEMKKLKNKKEDIKFNSKNFDLYKYSLSYINSIPIDYKNKQIEITGEELRNGAEKNLVPHLPKGNYINCDRYLNTLFYLEYEDCYRSLKNTIQKICLSGNLNIEKVEKEHKDVYYYINASIPGVEATSEGIILTIDFETVRNKKVKFTKRMIFGSLLILTDQNLTDFLFITVFHNPYIDKRNPLNKKRDIRLPRNKYRILAKLVNSSMNSFKFLIDYRKDNLQIFESKAYFENYVHLLKRLKELNANDLPFQNQIIKNIFTTSIPKYIPYKKYLTYNNKRFDINGTFPLELTNKLDQSQLNAIKLVFQNEIALIQGPPGTGKTYMAEILTSLLLQNINSPILVVCYTNHALDQFIERIMKYTDQIIRVGGRCNSEKVQEFMLKNFKKIRDKRIFRINKQIKDLSEKMENFIHLLDYKHYVYFDEAYYFHKDLIDKIINDFYILTGINNRIPNTEKDLYKVWCGKLDIKHIYNAFGIKANQRPIFQFFLDKNNNTVLLKDKQLPEDIFYNPNLNKIENNPDLNFLNQENNNEIENEESEDDEDELEENYERLEYTFISDQSHDSIQDDYFEQEIDTTIKLTENQILDIIISNNLWQIGPRIRKEIMNYMKNQILERNPYDFSLLKAYEESLNQKIEIDLISDSEIIKQNKIIAMTTTGCAKYSTILEQNNFEIVIIEEAAEVLEPHIITTLTKNTKHLIMIGDHKQLRPKPYNYEMIIKYNFDISLFERLINNHIPFSSLKYQRRMKSIFADFVRLIYGSTDYIDYDNDDLKEKIKGIGNDMFFITHSNLEKENENLASKSNEYEAKYLIRLCNYFIKQGYESERITILTFYTGQVLLLRNLMKNENFKVRISSVDNYQGEENDIILLSLVRSNKQYSIGFLKNFNRVCVAFSRAKLGFYIIGNLDCIIEGEKLKSQKEKIDSRMNSIWQRIKNLLTEKNIISNKLTLICQRHKNKTEISSLSDFSKIPEGGCDQICHARLPCGHTCELLCHNTDHKNIKCKKQCTKKLNCGHQCTKYCFQECGKCNIKMEKTLPCGHKIFCECHENINLIKCEKKCEKRRKCGHICKLKCYEICESEKCKELMYKKLPCSHINKYECNIPITDLVCIEPCKKILICGHECKGTCGECLRGTLHIPCKNKCDKGLICGHRCKQLCSQECLCVEKCPNICKHGYCELICCEECVNCQERCNIGCVHRKCGRLCYQICSIGRCNERCNIKMKCGHQCMGLCGERCPNICKICDPENENFNIFFGREDNDDALFYKTKCGHCIEYRDMDYYMDNDKSIMMPLCPKCKNILIDEPRYQNIIKEKLKDIQKVKKIIMERNGSEEYLNVNRKIIYNIMSDIKNGVIKSLSKSNINNLIQILKDTVHICLSFNPDIVQSRLITTYNILTQFPFFVGIEFYEKKIEESINLGKKIDNIDYLFMKNYEIIKKYFEGYQKFNNDFFTEFQRKIQNLISYVKIKETSFLSIFMLGGNDLLLKLEKNNFNCTKEELKKFEQKSDFESKQILRSLGTKWYKCPKGHLYVVGECGRPTEKSICPECGSSIGGINHVPERGNSSINIDNAF